jgi:hypothetical protein
VTFCDQCGAWLPTTARFCPGCGVTLDPGDGAVLSDQPAVQRPATPSSVGGEVPGDAPSVGSDGGHVPPVGPGPKQEGFPPPSPESAVPMSLAPTARQIFGTGSRLRRQLLGLLIIVVAIASAAHSLQSSNSSSSASTQNSSSSPATQTGPIGTPLAAGGLAVRAITQYPGLDVDQVDIQITNNTGSDITYPLSNDFTLQIIGGALIDGVGPDAADGLANGGYESFVETFPSANDRSTFRKIIFEDPTIGHGGSSVRIEWNY